MIRTEELTINGKVFIKTWSDEGKMIERDGALYEEAIDPAEFGRTYTETDVDIELSETDALAELKEVLEDEEI